MFRSILLTCSRLHPKCTGSASWLSVGYKSQISVDKLYPNKEVNYGSHPFSKKTEADEGFSGVIPVDELDIRYSRSGGPGGQHVNKVNSKVEVRFHVNSANWIPDWIKPNILEKEKNRLTKDGYLIVMSEKTRKQILNQADCLDKIRDVVRLAAVKPYEPTEEEKKIIEKRKAKAKKKILREKRANSYKKQLRGSQSSFTI